MLSFLIFKKYGIIKMVHNWGKIQTFSIKIIIFQKLKVQKHFKKIKMYNCVSVNWKNKTFGHVTYNHLQYITISWKCCWPSSQDIFTSLKNTFLNTITLRLTFVMPYKVEIYSSFYHLSCSSTIIWMHIWLKY